MSVKPLGGPRGWSEELIAGAGDRADGVPTALVPALASADPKGSLLEADPPGPTDEAGGAPSASAVGELLLVTRRLGVVAEPGMVLADGVPTAWTAAADALAAAFFEMPSAFALMAILELGSDPGLRPGDLCKPCASRALARSACALRPATVPRSGL